MYEEHHGFLGGIKGWLADRKVCLSKMSGWTGRKEALGGILMLSTAHLMCHRVMCSAGVCCGDCKLPCLSHRTSWMRLPGSGARSRSMWPTGHMRTPTTWCTK